AARIELIEKPEALLCEGQGQRHLSRDRHEGGRSGALAGPLRRLDPGGEIRQPRRHEEIEKLHLDAEHAAQERRELHRQERMAAEIEKVIVRPDPLAFEELSPEAGENLLDRCPWS